MKTLLTLLFPLFIFGQSEIGYLFISENTIPLDKQIHGAAGIGLGTVSYMVAYGASGENRKTAKIWGMLVPTLAGTIKELADIKTTGFDWVDLGYTVAGGVVATYTFDFIVHRAKKRNAKRDNIIVMTNAFYD